MSKSGFKSAKVWLLFTLLAVIIVGFWQQQAIRDWMRLYNYQPAASISQLANQLQFTPQARKLFYVNHPQLEDRTAFNAACSKDDEHTIILGCYHPVDRGIYIYKVTDARLTGVSQVTAAHEMLHAAYDRLSGRERQRVDTMLQDFYQNKLQSERIKTIIGAYTKSEPNDVVNEMHAIFGTEIVELPGELETYYQQYFQDRSVVTAYAATYQAEFTSRQTQVSSYDKDLQILRQQIDANKIKLETQESKISVLRSQLETSRNAGDIATYNQYVPIYNAQIDAYNNLITMTKSSVARYNQLVQDRNAVALQVADLARSIDSSLQAIEQK
ncbi:MAG TPA: hypothetical protein VF575_02005 [Candidatus Saccharimonadales bacterium]|jgi:hypothetical protein